MRSWGSRGRRTTCCTPKAVPDHLAEVMHDIGPDYIDFTDMGSVSKWWVYRMLHTQRPLEEKMTLFWHGHFATAYYKVDNPALDVAAEPDVPHLCPGQFPLRCSWPSPVTRLC